MIRNCTQLSYQIEDKYYHFTCDIDATTSKVKEVASQIIADMVEIERKVAEQQAANEAAKEESKED